jgi:hypothetical protein
MNDLFTTSTASYDNDNNKDITIHKFTYNQQQNIIKLYNDNDNKIIAMQYIHLLPNCNNLNENNILHWMSKAKTGKSISVEFENEVMLACKKLDFFFNNNNNKNNNKKSYSYTTIRECAKKIFDKDYWDDSSKSFIKKWHHDKRTYKLLFTNKWVTGMLKRRNNCYSSLPVSSANISSSSQSSLDSLSSTSLPSQSSSSSLVMLSNALKSLQSSEASTIINAISDHRLSPHSLINVNACKYYQPHHYHFNDDFDTIMENSPDFFGDSRSISSFEFQDWIEFDSPF